MAVTLAAESGVFHEHRPVVSYHRHLQGFVEARLGEGYSIAMGARKGILLLWLRTGLRDNAITASRAHGDYSWM